MTVSTSASPGLPAWLPEAARLYLRHTENGVSIRALARKEGLHASTVLRRVRSYENRRDDPLIDEALESLGRAFSSDQNDPDQNGIVADDEGKNRMTKPIRKTVEIVDAATVDREARRILRRLCEPGAMLVVAPEMAKAVVLKGTVRTSVVDRPVAHAFALKDWISIIRAGKITTYEITAAGRAALKRFLVEDASVRTGTDDAASFGDQHREFEERAVCDEDGPRRQRYNLSESPLTALARRRDKDGTSFLTTEMVTAGERLREDFELAQLGPRVAQNWDRFLTVADRGNFADGGGGGNSAARDRVATALRELGPGLGDMVLRCCCFLEGLEIAERRLGWSARSGKIVLRIALIRLARHYTEAYGKYGPKIG